MIMMIIIIFKTMFSRIEKGRRGGRERQTNLKIFLIKISNINETRSI